jgi:hypothetical protein
MNPEKLIDLIVQYGNARANSTAAAIRDEHALSSSHTKDAQGALNLARFEIEKLFDELGSARDWEAWERMQKRIAELEAMWASAKPVLDAAEEWYAAFEYEELDENYSAEERVLFNTIKANPSCPSCGPGGCAGHTRKLSEVERKLPVCAECGHRHRWGGECADHSWTDACPYDANGDCEGVVCPRCGGRDGTHTVRNCEKDMAGCGRHECPWLGYHCHGDSHGYCCVEGVYLVQPDGVAVHRDHLAAEGLSSTDTTAVERD